MRGYHIITNLIHSLSPHTKILISSPPLAFLIPQHTTIYLPLKLAPHLLLLLHCSISSTSWLLLLSHLCRSMNEFTIIHICIHSFIHSSSSYIYIYIYIYVCFSGGLQQGRLLRVRRSPQLLLRRPPLRQEGLRRFRLGYSLPDLCCECFYTICIYMAWVRTCMINDECVCVWGKRSVVGRTRGEWLRRS